MKYHVGQAVLVSSRCRVNGKWDTRGIAAVVTHARQSGERPYTIRLTESVFPHDAGDEIDVSEGSIKAVPPTTTHSGVAIIGTVAFTKP